MDDMLDIAIIGAGLAGVAAAARLKEEVPHKSLRIFDRRQRIGGTWDLFRYPGIRSDSDMYTLGYSFNPWKSDEAIVGGEDIRDYIEATARKHGLIDHIDFGQQLMSANWSSEARCWTLNLTEVATGNEHQVRARMIYMASGYYDQDKGYRPTFDGEADFTGQIVHPQHWPDDLNVAGRDVAIIGSGATAVTLGPALAQQGAQVQIVQRSPSYVMPVPKHSAFARTVFRLLPGPLAYKIVRGTERRVAALFYRFSRKRPSAARRYLTKQMVKALGDEAMVSEHFNPRYDPWTQRLCVAADGDFFAAIQDGSVEMVTGEIDRFEAGGIRMKSGALVQSDIIVTATGLRIALFGKAEISVDGKRVRAPRELLYKGAMLSGVPNMVFMFGYTSASWTLKAELVAQYAARLIHEMDRRGATVADPGQPDEEINRVPMTDFSSGYFRRSAAIMPRQGDRGPWTLPMDYGVDRQRLLKDRVDDDVLRFS